VLETGSVGVPYSESIAVIGGTAPFTFAVTSGSLPPGLTLSTAGVITGTPTTVVTSGFTVTVTDASSVTGSQAFRIGVVAGPLSISCGSPPDGTFGTPYNHSVAVIGGTPPYTYALNGALPPGLTFDPATGIISGTPVQSGGSFVHFDPDVENDQGNPVDNFWESGLVRGSGEMNSSMVRFGVADVWIRGQGPILVTVYGPDKKAVLQTPLRNVNGQPVTELDPTPGIMYALKFDLPKVENATFRFETDATDAWFEMSGFRAYFRPDLYNR
jgi:hypothetical protein